MTELVMVANEVTLCFASIDLTTQFLNSDSKRIAKCDISERSRWRKQTASIFSVRKIIFGVKIHRLHGTFDENFQPEIHSYKYIAKY